MMNATARLGHSQNGAFANLVFTQWHISDFWHVLVFDSSWEQRIAYFKGLELSSVSLIWSWASKETLLHSSELWHQNLPSCPRYFRLLDQLKTKPFGPVSAYNDYMFMIWWTLCFSRVRSESRKARRDLERQSIHIQTGPKQLFLTVALAYKHFSVFQMVNDQFSEVANWVLMSRKGSTT